jgi:hypothetical protein
MRKKNPHLVIKGYAWGRKVKTFIAQTQEKKKTSPTIRYPIETPLS